MNVIKKLTVIFLVSFISTADITAQAQDDGQYQLLQKTIGHYEKLKARGPLEPISLGDKSLLRVNDHSPAVKTIKERLELLGDMRRSGFLFGGRKSSSDVYTQNMEDAVKRFQKRHGMEDDGIIGPAVLKALNTPLDTRIKQLQVNMDRLLADSIQYSGKRLVANIPEYKLHVYDEGPREVLTMDIVVGEATNPTIIFSDEMEHIVFSPYWNVPPNIVRNEIIPAIKKNPRYLRNENMEITGTEDGLPVIRQRPGPKNALGKVKFMFPNKYNIYFHDTPAKALFERNRRAFSHGCIRLSKPFELAKFLLKDQDEWTDENIQKAMNAGVEKWVELEEHVPVFISYYTAWVDSEGTVHFRDDIYGHDKDMVRLEQ